MENFKRFTDIEFKTTYLNEDYSESVAELKEYITHLNQCFEKEQNNLAEIAYCVYRINKLFSDYKKSYYFGFETKNRRYTFDTIMISFGFDKTQVCRILQVFERFVYIENDKPKIKDYVSEFGKSKLFELLAVDDEQLQKDISNLVVSPDMSVYCIRLYVKNYKLLQKQKKKKVSNEEEKQEQVSKQELEEEIPPAYNPQQHYDFEYFEKKSKAELLNMIWDLQKAYENLVNTNNKVVSSSTKSSSKSTSRKKNVPVENVKSIENAPQDKALTVDEIKKLEAGGVLLGIVNIVDNTEFYAWVVNSNDSFNFEDCLRVDVRHENKSLFLRYIDYGITWLAYRLVGLNSLFKN